MCSSIALPFNPSPKTSGCKAVLPFNPSNIGRKARPWSSSPNLRLSSTVLITLYCS